MGGFRRCVDSAVGGRRGVGYDVGEDKFPARSIALVSVCSGHVSDRRETVVVGGYFVVFPDFDWYRNLDGSVWYSIADATRLRRRHLVDSTRDALRRCGTNTSNDHSRLVFHYACGLSGTIYLASQCVDLGQPS